MKVEVAYALAERQWLVALDVAGGTTAHEAVAQSGLVGSHEALAAGPLRLALFGRVIASDLALREGDRIEILRPLVADPKDVRRKLAAEGKVMGRRRPG